MYTYQNLITNHLKALSVNNSTNKLLKQYKSTVAKTIENEDIVKEHKYLSKLNGKYY